MRQPSMRGRYAHMRMRPPWCRLMGRLRECGACGHTREVRVEGRRACNTQYRGSRDTEEAQ